MALRESAMLDLCAQLKPEEFSVPLLGNVYSQLQSRHAQHLAVSVASLEDLSGEEASHIASIVHQQTGPVNEQAMKDYISIIQSESRKRSLSSMDDIMSMRNKMKESKGYKA